MRPSAPLVQRGVEPPSSKGGVHWPTWSGEPELSALTTGAVELLTPAAPASMRIADAAVPHRMYQRRGRRSIICSPRGSWTFARAPQLHPVGNARRPALDSVPPFHRPRTARNPRGDSRRTYGDRRYATDITAGGRRSVDAF